MLGGDAVFVEPNVIAGRSTDRGAADDADPFAAGYRRPTRVHDLKQRLTPALNRCRSKLSPRHDDDEHQKEIEE